MNAHDIKETEQSRWYSPSEIEDIKRKATLEAYEGFWEKILITEEQARSYPQSSEKITQARWQDLKDVVSLTLQCNDIKQQETSK